MRRVVITGMGTVNPIGNNVADTWEACKAGKCGIDFITSYDTTDMKVKVAGEVKDLNLEEYIDKKELKKMDRFTALAIVAAREAMADCGTDFADIADSTGVIIASGVGGLETTGAEHQKGVEKGMDRISPYFIPAVISNMAAGRVAIEHNLHGMCTCVVTACASSTNALGDAFHYIRDGYADAMVTGGAEACVIPQAIGGFTTLQAVTRTDDPKRASIPFDKNRSGFVLSEGAAVLVLEELEHAKARGAKIYAEVVGYGANCDAHHITAPAPEGKYAADCMLMAVKDAGIEAKDIDYINAHGTSTHMNELCETIAIKNAFGDHAKELMVSSTKSMTGHLLGAAGAIEGIFCAMAVKEGYVPATIGYETPDEECDLDVVPNEGRNVDITYALSNSLGFGGHNACIIVKKYA